MSVVFMMGELSLPSIIYVCRQIFFSFSFYLPSWSGIKQTRKKKKYNSTKTLREKKCCFPTWLWRFFTYRKKNEKFFFYFVDKRGNSIGSYNHRFLRCNSIRFYWNKVGSWLQKMTKINRTFNRQTSDTSNITIFNEA